MNSLEIKNKKPLVLVVDDNPNNIQAVGANLLRENIGLAMSSDGPKAIIAAKLIKPDLILLDIMMPEMDGFEVADILKSDPETKDIPIIFLTAKTETEDMVKGFELGAVDYITKPFNSAELIARVRTHLQLKQFQDIINEKNNQLELLNNDKNELLGIAAHDLKNPIYNISMLAKVIKEEELDKEEIDEFATDILKTSERMLDLIKNLLDINAIEQGKIKMFTENINISELAKSSVENYKDRASAKNIVLNYKSETDEINSFADSNFTMQILDNLISNAIKYSPYDKNVWINVLECKENIQISVKDEGPGLSDDDQKKLFGKFTKLTPQPTGDEHSTGLGLSIVKKYAEAMNGTITVQTSLGAGCNFIVELPKAVSMEE